MADAPRVRAGAGAVVLGVALLAWLIAAGMFPKAVAMSVLSDDAYYYLKIGRSIAQGHGSTFDGIARTNGYHPLWMLVSVAVQRLAGSDLVSPLRPFLVISGLLAALTLALVHRVVDRFIAAGYGFLAVAACLLPTVITALTNGLETAPQLFALTVLVWAWYRGKLGDPEAGAGKRFALGLLLGLVFLCRLDSAFIVLVAGLLAAAGLLTGGVPLPRAVGRLAAMGVGVGLPVAGFFAWNLRSFGHLSPISGAVKTSFPSVRQSLVLNGDLLFGLVLLAATTLVVALAVVAKHRAGRPLRSFLDDPLLALWGGCLLHYLHAFLFLGWGVYWWHMAPYGLTFALALPAAAEILGRSRTAALLVRATAAAMVALAVFVQLARVTATGDRHRTWLEAAEWARDHTRPDAVFALKDAGLFGYFSRRAVVNLDGKANGYEYRDFLLNGDVEEYLQQVHTRYLADTAAHYHDGLCRIPLPRVNRPPLSIVAREAWEVYRSDPVPPRPFRAKPRDESFFGIWRLPEDPVEWTTGTR